MFSDQPNCYNPFDHIKKPSSHNPPPIFNFQDSSFFDRHELALPLINHQVLLQNPINTAANMFAQENNIIVPSPDEKQVGILPGAASVRRLRNPGAIPRRRAGKKDRHSKICTAQGIRDRRMRLSLQIARKFFDLQDMLGYDKASKTIEWLFTKSKKAIKELIKEHPQYYDDHEDDAKSESFVSECEVMSRQPATMIEEDIANPSEREEIENPKGGSKPNDLRLASREKARARARWRTREKMMIRILEGSGNYNSSNKSSNPSYDKYGFDQKSGFSNGPIFEGVDQGSSLCGNIYGDVGTIEKFLGNSSIICCPNNTEYQNRGVSDYNMDPNSSFMGFFGSWDVLNNERTSSIPYAVVNDQANPSSVQSGTPR